MKLDFKTRCVLNGLRVCGNMNYSQLNSIISQNRIRFLEKEKKLIQKIPYQDKHISRTKSCYTYRLTKLGKNFCRNNGMSHFSIGKGEERHQTAVADFYTSLPFEQQILAMNDMDQQQYFTDQAYKLLESGFYNEGSELLEKLQHASYLDIVVITESEILAYEVISSNYSTEDIASHQSMSEIIKCSSYQTININ